MSACKLSKHSARIAAVQVMYQLDIVGGDIDKILSNFLDHYIKNENIFENMNKKFLKKLVSHFVEDINFDSIIKSNLVKNDITSSITKSIIKVAIIEMTFENTDIPVIINEYVNVSKYFLDQKSISFINAVLDKISKNIERKAVCRTNV
jgi:N utilization substance protein B